MKVTYWIARAALLTGVVWSATSAASIAATPDACALLSRWKVREVVGSPVGEGESRLISTNFTRCLFHERSGGNTAILVRRFPSGNWESEQMSRLRRSVELGTYREVAGIGDRAFLGEMRQGAVLCVFEGERYLQVSVFRIGGTGGSGPVLEKLARYALARLRTERRVEGL